MVTSCRNDVLRWYIVYPGYRWEASSCEEFEMALKESPSLKLAYDRIVEAVNDPDSVASYLLRWLPPGEKIRVFLRSQSGEDKMCGSTLRGYVPLAGGIYIYVADDNSESLDTKFQCDTDSIFSHELWHFIYGSYFTIGLEDVVFDFVYSGPTAYKKSNKKASFEEAFAAMLGFVASRGRINYISGGIVYTREGINYIADDMSPTYVSALDCLMSLANQHPKMWRLMVKVVLGGNAKMTLSDFLRRLEERHPDIAKVAMTDECIFADQKVIYPVIVIDPLPENGVHMSKDYESCLFTVAVAISYARSLSARLSPLVRWGFNLKNEYRVVLTIDGPDSRHDAEEGRIFIRGDDSKQLQHYTWLIVREIIRIGISDVVRKYGLMPDEKERVVELIFRSLFLKSAPLDYEMVDSGDRRIDEFVAKAPLSDLPSAIERYVRKYPR